MNLQDLDKWIRKLLAIDEFSSIDNSLNGIQVAHSQKDIHKISFAVDACIESFNRCENSDVLIVHHGIFWGNNDALVGSLYDRVSTLIQKNLALYAIHLPIDASENFGNNYGIARYLGLQNLRKFALYKGKYIGVSGVLPQACDLYNIQQQLSGNAGLGILPFGKRNISTIAIVSGGGVYDVNEAIDQGIDLFITGDASHNIYHVCLEAGINVLFAGHYFTETWGLKLLMEEFNSTLGKEYNIKTEFIEIPTGL